jgi:hypothetical protein
LPSSRWPLAPTKPTPPTIRSPATGATPSVSVPAVSLQDIESCATELTFTSDLEIALEARWVSLAATEINPGCTTTRLVTGQKWFTSQADGTFTVTGDSAATLERSNCVDTADDLPQEETMDIAIPSGEQNYSISGDTLTISSGELQGVYTR